MSFIIFFENVTFDLDFELLSKDRLFESGSSYYRDSNLFRKWLDFDISISYSHYSISDFILKFLFSSL